MKTFGGIAVNLSLPHYLLAFGDFEYGIHAAGADEYVSVFQQLCIAARTGLEML